MLTIRMNPPALPPSLSIGDISPGEVFRRLNESVLFLRVSGPGHDAVIVHEGRLVTFACDAALVTVDATLSWNP